MKKLKLIFSIFLAFLFTACTSTVQSTVTTDNKTLQVHFLDVGQADCSLIKLPTGENVLIDGGNRGDKDYILEYLKNQGVEKLDVVVATHPHEDHIGALSDIVRSVNTEKIFLPTQDIDTIVYTNLLYAIEEQAVEEHRVTDPLEFVYGDVKFNIIAPLKEHKEINNSSIVAKVTFGGTSFLFTGDVEKEGEVDILESGKDVSANVLKVAHHGSKTSSTKEFLKAVNPQIAVIQVGANNEYNLPSALTIDTLDSMGTQVLRTDINGDIVVESDGENIRVLKNIEENVAYVEEVGEEEFVGNVYSKVFHSSKCGSLPNKENREYFKSIEKAEAYGFKRHKVCVEKGS